MGLRLDSKVDVEKIEPGATAKVAAGRCHVEIVAASDKDQDTNNPYTVFALKMLAHDVPEEVGKVHNQRYYWHATNEVAHRMNHEAIVLFATQCGVKTKAELAAAAKAGDEINFDWSRAIGKQLLVEIESRSYKDKNNTEKTAVSLKPGVVFTLSAEAASNWPRNARAAAIADAEVAF